MGSLALNIIPDRNWNFADPEVKAHKLKNWIKWFLAAAAEICPSSSAQSSIPPD